MTNYAMYFPLNGRGGGQSTMVNGCGVPVECCCGGGFIQARQNSLNSSFISFEGFLQPLEKNGTTYAFKNLLAFTIEDATGAVVAQLDAVQLAAPDIISQALPLLILPAAFSLEEIKIFTEKGRRGIRIRHNVPLTSPLGGAFKINYKARFKSICDEGLIIEIPDCAMLEIVKC